MEIPTTPLLFYIIIGIMMLGSFVIGFLFGSMKPKSKSSNVSKEVELMAAKVLEVEQKLNAVQQRVEIADIENSNQVHVVKTDELTDAPSTASRNSRILEEEMSKKHTIRKSTSIQKDDLQQITGIGPSLEEKLNDIGYYTYEQLSQLTDEDAEAISQQLNLFSGRIHRDNWVEQAKDLYDSRILKSNA